MKLSVKEVKKMSNIEVVINFDKCVTELTKEVNGISKETRQTSQTYELLKRELLDRLNDDRDYDDIGNII